VSRLFRVRNRIRNARFGFGQSGEAGGATPLTIFGSDLILWFNAKQGVFSDAGVTPAVDAGTVQQWNDLSGNGYHLVQATGANRPLYDVDGLNNLPALVAGGQAAAQYMATADVVAFGGATAVSFFVVGTLSDPPGAEQYGRFISSSDADANSDFGNNSGFNLCQHDTNEAVGNFFFDNAVDGVVAATYETPYRFGGTINGAVSTTYVDNVAGTPDTTGGSLNLGTNVFRIFRDTVASAGQYLTGNCSEIGVVKRLVTELERAALDDYFVSEWAFS
jgi:hypothetical protein